MSRPVAPARSRGSRRPARRRGLTLLELLVAIVVVGLLALVAVPMFRSALDGTRDSVVEQSAEAMAREANALAPFNGGADVLQTSEQNIDDVLNAAVAKGEFAAGDGWTVDTATNAITLANAGGTQTMYVCLDGGTPVRAVAQTTACDGGGGPTTTLPQFATAPGAPLITSLTAGGTTLEVAFTAPGSDGGSAITDYEYTINSGTSWVSAGASSPFTITGLSNGTAYQVQLRAVNSVGAGSASAASTGTPVAPLSLSYVSTSFSTATTSETQSPTVSGGSGPITYSYTGALPTGVSFDTATGTFTGPAAWNFEAMQVSASTYHSCALTSAGGVKCWGDNSSGQLGDGTRTTRNSPVQVLTSGSTQDVNVLSGVTQISAAASHTCALLADTTVRCWGNGFWGSLGDGTTTQRLNPVQVLTSGSAQGVNVLSDVAEISAGYAHTCALLADTTVRCWGNNGSGQLGAGTDGFVNEPNPLQVLTSGSTQDVNVLSDVAEISAGVSHTCARLTDGTARCWGANDNRQLGDGNATATATANPNPRQVLTSGNAQGVNVLSGVAEISAGDSYTCAVLTDGTARCWGRNSNGWLGDGTTTSRANPVQVLTAGSTQGVNVLSGVTSISAGDSHTCARLTDGTARCWGRGNYGQLGDGTTTQRLNPRQVLTSGNAQGVNVLSGVAEISAGDSHTCARLTDGTARCWGFNGDAIGGGQLGDGTIGNRLNPVQVLAAGSTQGVNVLSGVASISVGRSHTCARLTAGTVRCWGNNSSGRLGDGTLTSRWNPVEVPTIGNPGWPANIQVTVADANGTVAPVQETVTLAKS